MLKTLELLGKSKIVEKYNLLDFQQGDNFYFLKIKAELVDESVLYIREFVSESEFDYSYHWQDKNGNLITRWDNAPHHTQVQTFPHHKHTPDVEASNEIGFQEVFVIIEQKLLENE
ncbi:MAG: DUF6516 family protein [Candidatus Thorarchaeota archaeon]|nr:DUF6516 family protein [Candidatus Thorarchaeota archaeon]